MGLPKCNYVTGFFKVFITFVTLKSFSTITIPISCLLILITGLVALNMPFLLSLNLQLTPKSVTADQVVTGLFATGAFCCKPVADESQGILTPST